MPVVVRAVKAPMAECQPPAQAAITAEPSLHHTHFANGWLDMRARCDALPYPLRP